MACNEYLSPENHIDHRSYIEQGVEKLPTVHEGYAARGLSECGVAVDVVEENKHRINLNEKHAALKLTEKKFQADLDDVKADFKNRREEQNAKRKGIGTGDKYVKGLSENDSRVRRLNSSDAGRVKANGQGIGGSEQEDNRTAGYDKQTLFDCSRLSFIRAKISDLVDRIGTVIEVFGNLGARKSEVERISRRIAEVKSENETKKYIVPSMRAVIKSNLALAKSYFGFINRMAKIYDVKEDAGLAFRLKDDTVCYISADELGDEYTERMLRLYYLDNSLYTEIEFAIKKLLKYRHQKEKYGVCYNRYDSVENINLQINLSNIMYKYNISCYKDLTDQIVDTKLLMQELKRNKLFEKNQYTEKSEALTYLKEYTKVYGYL